LKAIILTDSRCVFETDDVVNLGVDDKCFHVTSDPDELGHGMLTRMTPGALVTLTKDAYLSFHLTRQTGLAMRIINEVDYHLDLDEHLEPEEGGGSLADSLQNDPKLTPYLHGLTADELRFASFTIGVKV
jgi:hypothetical protein